MRSIIGPRCIFIVNSQVNAEHEDAAASAAAAATTMVLRRLKSMVALVVTVLLRREIMATALSMELPKSTCL
jgi:hypothetical protein